MTNPVTASEVLGELRRAARQYEVFAKAVAAAEVLANEEKYLAQLKAEIKAVEAQVQKADKDIDELAAVKAKVIEEAEKKVDAAKEAKAKAEDDAKKNLAVIKEQAAKIIAAANAEADGLLGTINKLKTQKQEAEQATKQAEARLKSVEEEIKARKDAILKI